MREYFNDVPSQTPSTEPNRNLQTVLPILCVAMLMGASLANAQCTEGADCSIGGRHGTMFCEGVRPVCSLDCTGDEACTIAGRPGTQRCTGGHLGSCQPDDCDDLFHFEPVADTKCLDGTETGFEYICSGSNRPDRPSLVLFIDSGGACWNAEMCSCARTSDGHTCDPDTPLERKHYNLEDSFNRKTRQQSLPRALQAIANAEGAYDVVHIPYCTGDLHMGDMTVGYPRPFPVTGGDTDTPGGFLRAYHWGYHNIARDLQKIAVLFPEPSSIVIWGSSAGGFGADCNLEQILAAWQITGSSGVQVFAMNNSGTPFGSIYTPLLPYVTSVWGAWAPGPDGEIVRRTCPISVASPGHPGPGRDKRDPTGASWSVSHIIRYNKLTFPWVRKALTDDYNDAGTASFACLMQIPPRLDPGCPEGREAVDNTLTDLLYAVIGDDPTYKVFYHQGECHAEREFTGDSHFLPGCQFNGMQQGGVMFSDWVNGWLRRNPTWDNVKRPFEPVRPPPQ